MAKNLPPIQETQVESLGQEDTLESEMVIHSSILAWKIPWIEESCKIHLIRSQRLKTTEHTHSHKAIGD